MEVISNWDGESSKVIIESFRRKNDCLVIIKIRHLSEKHHFLKSAILIKPSDLCNLMKLQTSAIRNFMKPRTLSHYLQKQVKFCIYLTFTLP